MVWEALATGKVIGPQQSESYLEIALPKWVLSSEAGTPKDRQALANLAAALQKNHHDPWLRDFLDAPFSGRANLSLKSAIESNRSGDWDRAVGEAKTAETLYVRSGNVPGAARSQLETIYAYRRHSRASECVNEIGSLNRRLQKHSYTGLQLLAGFESSICQSMRGNFDLGWRLAQQTISEADTAHYPALTLRAKSLLSAMDSAEGRLREAFQGDEDGLDLFWQGAFPSERGFQFYSDAALTAEQAGLWHVAIVLQREALSMLVETNRFDFQAMAHNHVAMSARMAGVPSLAQQQLEEAHALFAKMPNGLSQKFIQAVSEVELASIEITEQKLDSAQAHLENAASTVQEANNFVVRLNYFNAWARLERQRSLPEAEWEYLVKAIGVAKQGFASLASMEDRWEWYREVDQAYHRLIELELDMKHDPLQALADWEDYRAAEMASANLEPGSESNRRRLLSRIEKIRSVTFISFIVFEKKVSIWVADRRGIRNFPVNIDSETLKHEAEGFLHLCSDPDSPLEKVNQAGSRLYEQLLKPIEHEIKPDGYLAIEADGFLSRVPWTALVIGNGEYLGQQYMTVGTPGLYFEPARPPAADALRNALVVYPGAVEYENKQFPPLPHAKEEADFVAKLHPGTVYLREEQATVSQLVHQLSQASLFHFAGHAVSREHGGELLLPGNEVLSSSTIRRLDLRRTKLVILAACSTADADSDIARSPKGLVQAFLTSGAWRVVATRWDSDSGASASFMKGFYRSLDGKTDAVRAMKAARDEVRQHKATVHPYYWSAFDLFESAN